ncbi:hypothetical protein [Methylobacterium nigriterrae]|uniref:hypothetical protein n=1 Tax=Methylobacterium nigriterrae TaxID=3127512 RepID=UPI003013E045
MLAKLFKKSRIDHSEDGENQPNLPLELYEEKVISFADGLLKPQSFIDPLYDNVRGMAAALDKTAELEGKIQSAFEAGKSAEEASLSVMVMGLDYKAQIETVAHATSGSKFANDLDRQGPPEHDGRRLCIDVDRATGD